MSVDPVLETVLAIVQRVAGPGRSPVNVGRETRLSDDYWLDSIDLLKLVLACEAELGVTFDAEKDFGRTHFATVGGLADLIRSKQAVGRLDA